MRYAIVIEKAENNYSAYVPDLPGCVATGASLEEVGAEIREAIEFHLRCLPSTQVPHVDAGGLDRVTRRPEEVGYMFVVHESDGFVRRRRRPEGPGRAAATGVMVTS